MDYNKQIQIITDHFRNDEKAVEDFKIGVEFEHFIIDEESMETISYYGKDGVAETLKDLEEYGWKGSYEGDYILGAKKDLMTITLEPGSQFEFSVEARKEIGELEKYYLIFLEDVMEVLEKKNQKIIATGYHPNKKIDDITLLPKSRYDLMFNYFKSRGSHAHNMMKGTAAVQVSLDYKSEEDYIKKFKIANKLSPVLYALFDNSFYFEGEKTEKYNIRTHIWNNCDSYRSGIADGALDDDFGYRKYAEYVLNAPPIFTMKGDKVIPTGNKKMREVFDPEDYTVEELEHLLTMVFPDVRTKRYIEIRMMDSLPYPLNFGSVALLVGIIYSEENLDILDEYLDDIDIEDIEKAKLDIIENGLEGKLGNKTVLEIGRYLIKLAKKGLKEKDLKYILPLEKMIDKGENPYEITRQNADLGRKKALDWAIFKNNNEVK